MALKRPTYKQAVKSLLKGIRLRSMSKWCKSFLKGMEARVFLSSRPSSMTSNSSRLNSICRTRRTRITIFVIGNRYFSRLCPLICLQRLLDTKRRSENSQVNQLTDKITTQQTSELAAIESSDKKNSIKEIRVLIY